MNKLYEKLHAIYLKVFRGISKEDWEFKKFNEMNINQRADDVASYFCGFKYVIALDLTKSLTLPVSSVNKRYISSELYEYMYPQRAVGDHCIVEFLEVMPESLQYSDKIHIMQYSGYGIYQLFAATNNEEDAFMIKLRFG